MNEEEPSDDTVTREEDIVGESQPCGQAGMEPDLSTFNNALSTEEQALRQLTEDQRF